MGENPQKSTKQEQFLGAFGSTCLHIGLWLVELVSCFFIKYTVKSCVH